MKRPPIKFNIVSKLILTPDGNYQVFGIGISSGISFPFKIRQLQFTRWFKMFFFTDLRIGAVLRSNFWGRYAIFFLNFCKYFTFYEAKSYRTWNWKELRELSVQSINAELLQYSLRYWIVWNCIIQHPIRNYFFCFFFF